MMAIMKTEKRIVTNPLSEMQFSRLRTSIDWSNRQLAFPRQKRIEAIKAFVGMHYMENGSARVMPTNTLKMAVDIYVRQLVARAPRVMISTKRKDLIPVAANFELAINQIPDEIKLGSTLRKFITEALFSCGILKIGLSPEGNVLGHSYGKPFVDNVTIDDYFLDMSAKARELIQYEGNDYWLDYDDAMDMEWTEKVNRNDVKPDEYTVTGAAGEKRAEGVTNTSSADVFKERIWLRDVWLPAEQLLITYGVKSEKLFNVVEWDGPPRGPYMWLGFTDVPGNLLPLPPVAVWRDLNELENTLARKLGNQADAQKTVLGFAGGDDAGVLAFQDAADGSGIKYTGPEPRKLEAGGVDPKTLAFFLQTKELASYFAGNLDSLGGLAPQTQTIGQDKLLSEAASAQLRDMAAKTIEVIKEVFHNLAWYEWHDPVGSRLLEKKIPETDMSIPVEWNQDSRQGEFDLFDLDIDVYSLQDDSPGLKLQKLGAIVGQYILPLAPLIQQQMGQIDVQAILRDVAKFSDMHEVNDYVTFVDMPMGQQGEGQTAQPGAASGPPQPEAAGPQQQGGEDLMQQLMDMQ